MTIHVLLIGEDSLHAHALGKALVLHDFCVVYTPCNLIWGPATRSIHPDLILVDIQHSDLSEHLLALELCKFREGKRIPVIALATEYGPGVRHLAVASGCDDLIFLTGDSRRFAEALYQIVAKMSAAPNPGGAH